MMQIQANAAGVALGDDAEHLHQMRVGLRRLRSALGLFQNLLQAPEELIKELDWLAPQLGEARDWDVLSGTTLPALAEVMPDEIRLAEVKLVALGQAHEKHKAAAAAVSSPDFTRLILRFTRWLLGRGWRDTMSPQARSFLMARVTKFSRQTLEHVQLGLLKRGRKLHGATPKVRHRVRIAAKNTRYTTEFFQSLYSSKKMRPFVDALSTLQDELGQLNDAAVASRLLKELQEGRVNLVVDIAFIRRYLASHIETDDKKIRK